MRVIAGHLRGRSLRAPKGLATRPTTDRVREAWFSILGDVSGARVLDLYSGTGALGIEALSRGAEHAVFVESNPNAQAAIRSNLEQLNLNPQSQLLSLPVERSAPALAKLGPFDLVLADPPWTAMEQAKATLCRILVPSLFAEQGRAVLGHPKQDQLHLPETAGLTLISTRSWGDSGASFYQARAEST